MNPSDWLIISHQTHQPCRWTQDTNNQKAFSWTQKELIAHSLTLVALNVFFVHIIPFFKILYAVLCKTGKRLKVSPHSVEHARLNTVLYYKLHSSLHQPPVPVWPKVWTIQATVPRCQKEERHLPSLEQNQAIVHVLQFYSDLLLPVCKDCSLCQDTSIGQTERLPPGLQVRGDPGCFSRSRQNSKLGLK